MLLVFAVLGTASALAQATLVSNTGQTVEAGLTLVVGHSGANRWNQAIGFTTGDNAGGYTLSAVDVGLGRIHSNAMVRVSIYTTSSGAPSTSLHVLTSPSSLTVNATNTFTAPQNAKLSASTTYAIVFEDASSGTTLNHSYRITLTASNAEDSSKASGWSIANARYYQQNDGSWTSLYGNKPRVAIKGTAKTATPPHSVITSSEEVTYSGNAQEGFSLSPLGEGGSIVYGGRTIDIPVTRDECQSPDNPAVIIPRNVLDRVREITFELSVSPQDSPTGFRAEGCTADIDPGVTLGQTETVTVCLPPSEVEGKSDIHRYDGEWGRLPSQLETVNDEELVCGKTDTFSLFGVFLPVIESAEGVSYSEDAENGFSLTPLGVGGSIVYGEKTIDLSVTGDVASRDPAVIVPRNVLDSVNGITFELSGVSPHDPPPGLRLSGFTAEVNLGVTLGEGETVGVCFPSAGGDIYRYSEASGEWELLPSRSETVNGEEVLCAETGAVSLTGVFVEETGGCAVAAASKEGTVRWQGAVLNLLLVISVLLLAAKPGVYGRDAASG